jgi:hypothetical protein
MRDVGKNENRNQGDSLPIGEVKAEIISHLFSKNGAVPKADLIKHLRKKYGIKNPKNIKKHLKDLENDPCI